MGVYTKNKKRILTLILSVIVILIFISVIIYYLNYRKTISPNGEYEVYYNVFTDITTIERINSGIKGNLSTSAYKKPSFIWSTDSNLLVVNYGEVAEIINMKDSASRTLCKSIINDQLGALNTGNDELENCKIEVAMFLDNDHFAVKFSWPLDEIGYTISGWFIYEYSSSSFHELTVEKVKVI